jgi:2-polyprenyl-3-methyl-5-hydroxy-6-metoxy-1,4-benzoquinol methylase
VKIDHASLTTLRKYLDEMMYSLMDFRMSFHVEMSSLGFPTIQSLRAALRQLDAAHRVLFRLFRIGESVDDESIRTVLPTNVLEALVQSELLIQDEANEWRTPSLLIVPAEGLYLLVGIPPIYSTASRACNTGFDVSSSIVARSLPVSLVGLRVLDICSGSGIQALLCARRGADSVVGLELNEEAVFTARANAVLNHLDDRVEFRQSDKLAALDASERFDFVVCNTPSAPMISQTGEPSCLEQIGNIVLLDLLEQLPRHLQPGARGVVSAWRSFGFESRTYQLTAIASQLANEGFSTSAYIDQAPNTIESLMRGLQTEIERRPGMDRSDARAIANRLREQLQQPEKPVDGAYNQLLFIEHGQNEADLSVYPLFSASRAQQNPATI